MLFEAISPLLFFSLNVKRQKFTLCCNMSMSSTALSMLRKINSQLTKQKKHKSRKCLQIHASSKSMRADLGCCFMYQTNSTSLNFNICKGFHKQVRYENIIKDQSWGRNCGTPCTYSTCFTPQPATPSTISCI